MTAGSAADAPQPGRGALGSAAGVPEPGQGALGRALRRAMTGYWLRVDKELAVAGFADRRFPDGRVLVMCSASAETTISDIGRGLGITRQRAGKIVAGLKERGYLDLAPSPTDGREKILTLTPRAVGFLAAAHQAALDIEAQLSDEIGADGVERLFRSLDLISGGVTPDYRKADGPAAWPLRWRDSENRP
jgi:DNA-binding MarR family transcriptional regulator